MGELYLIYFTPKDLPLSEIYNPSDIPSFWAPANSRYSDLLKAKENDVVLIQRIGPGQFEIIRRTKHPYSHNQFIELISLENGNGNGSGERSVFNIGESELFNLGTPFGLTQGGKLSTWILIAIAILIIINSR